MDGLVVFMKARQTSDNARKMEEMLAISPFNQLALMSIGHPNNIKMFDTTLRDGEQAPGIALSSDDKLRIALAIDDHGVDIMEAGFAASSQVDKDTIKRIVAEKPQCTVWSLARSVKEDVDAVIDTGADYIHTFIATSDLHMKYKLKMTPEQVKERAVEMVEYAREHGLQVQFSCEDATRSDLDFMKDVCVSVQDAGACAINLPDTVGVIVPQGMKYVEGSAVGDATVSNGSVRWTIGSLKAGQSVLVSYQASIPEDAEAATYSGTANASCYIESSEDSPKTADENQPGLWLASTTASIGTALGGAASIRRKRRG
jgi:hypothetical protein